MKPDLQLMNEPFAALDDPCRQRLQADLPGWWRTLSTAASGWVCDGACWKDAAQPPLLEESRGEQQRSRTRLAYTFQMTTELRASALRQARRLVEFYRITPEELTAPAQEVSVIGSSSCLDAAPEAPRPIKYRHPLTGDTWDGTGPHPAWMRQALLKDGYRVAELLVDPAVTTF